MKIPSREPDVTANVHDRHMREEMPNSTRDSARAEARSGLKWLLAAAALLVSGGFFMFWRGALPFEELIVSFARIDQWPSAMPLASNPVTLRRYYALSVGAALLILGLLAMGCAIWTRLSTDARGAVFRLTTTVGCSCALMAFLIRMSFDGPWSPPSVVMHNPSALPIFGHRLLFVWVALGFQAVVPSLSDLRAFYLSQAVAVVLMAYLLEKWSELHIGKTFAWLGQVFGAFLLSMCFSYHNFYDIGIVFFTTWGLLALYARRYWWLVPCVALGTLNHEGILFLVLVAAFVAYFDAPLRKWVPPVALSLLMYIVDRYALQAAIPFAHHVDWRLWSNMAKPFVMPKEIGYSTMVLTPWFALTLMGLWDCDARLRRMTLYFPLLVGSTLLFGQFQEPRQFDAFIPILTAIVLQTSLRRFKIEGATACQPHAT